MLSNWLARIALAAIAMASTAEAQRLQFQCGELRGQSYYAEENLVPEGEGGWAREAVTGGESVITVNVDADTIDYRFKDSTGVWQSPEEEGGALRFLSADPADSSFQFFALYPDQSIEIITIAEIEGGAPKMIYQASRNGPIFTSAKLMVAECRFPEPVWE